MIQCSSERFENGHRDTVTPITKFLLVGLECVRFVYSPYQDDANPPTIYIMQSHDLLCGIRLDKPLFWSREYGFTDEQKKEINNFVNSINEERANQGWSPLNIWFRIKSFWKMQNDRLEKINLPEDPSDYTKLP